MRLRLSSKPVQATRSAARCQPIVSTGFPPVYAHGEPRPKSRFLTAEAVWNDKGIKPLRSTAGSRTLSSPFGSSFGATERLLPHPLQCLFRHEAFLARAILGASGRKTFTWEKILWRFLRPALKPFEELCPRMQPRGRSDFSGF